MPNFWSSTTQTFQELLLGPKLKDKILELKKHEYEDLSKVMSFLEKTFEKYIDYLKCSNKLLEEIKENAYEFNFPDTFIDYKDCFIYYCKYINEKIEFNNSFILNLHKKKIEFEEMQKGYSLFNSQFEENDKYRKTFNHYNEKLDQMLLKIEKMRKEQPIEDVKKYEQRVKKNELKYEEALTNYINSNNKIYSLLNDVIYKREKKIIIFINDMINQIQTERDKTVVLIKKTMSNVKNIFKERMKIYKKSEYDPMNSICDNRKTSLNKSINQSSIINKSTLFQSSNNLAHFEPYSLHKKQRFSCNDALVKDFHSFQSVFSNKSFM